MGPENEKLLNLMRYWIFGTVVIVLVAVTVYAGLFVGMNILGDLSYWLYVVILVALGALWYYGYRWYLKRQE